MIALAPGDLVDTDYRKWSDSDYRRALSEIDLIFDAKRGTPESFRCDALFNAIETYERIHYPMPEPSAAAMAEFLHDQQGESASL